MHPKIETLIEEAETRYLKPEEIEAFKQYAINIAQSLKTYEFLRENEVKIFQPIADQLVAAFPQVPQETLERSLKHWVLVLRYSAMAMLTNDAQYLETNLLDWLKGLVQTHQSMEIETKLYQLLQNQLKTLMAPPALALLQPFLSKSKTMLIEG
ncbi:phycobilisome protein [Ancylothrix sp. C2]|uniref:phycobilisome protein n=1 Tax=Ancylothrix sp. D3o TaxID=2953691 RepID=UPI0021BA5FC1|nr:phycobilisome protein [Ancylothrix sp. D3o]MCT7950638.1 phycobilisome protein [Ancylothrix sp. D3o]